MTQTRLNKLCIAMCEAEYNGTCVCAPTFGVNCTRPTGRLPKQVHAILSALLQMSPVEERAVAEASCSDDCVEFGACIRGRIVSGVKGNLHPECLTRARQTITAYVEALKGGENAGG